MESQMYQASDENSSTITNNNVIIKIWFNFIYSILFSSLGDTIIITPN